MLSLHLPSRAVLMHVFIRTFKLKIYFLEFSGLFYYSVIKVPSLSLKDLVAVVFSATRYILSHLTELVNNFFYFSLLYFFKNRTLAFQPFLSYLRQRYIIYQNLRHLSTSFFKNFKTVTVNCHMKIFRFRILSMIFYHKI